MKRTKQIKRLHVGPLDLITAPTGLTARLVDNRLMRRLSKPDVPLHVDRGRVTRADLDAAAARSPEAAEIVERIRGMSWYHTLDLGHGVLTPGFVKA